MFYFDDVIESRDLQGAVDAAFDARTLENGASALLPSSGDNGAIPGVPIVLIPQQDIEEEDLGQAHHKKPVQEHAQGQDHQGQETVHLASAQHVVFAPLAVSDGDPQDVVLSACYRFNLPDDMSLGGALVPVGSFGLDAYSSFDVRASFMLLQHDRVLLHRETHHGGGGIYGGNTNDVLYGTSGNDVIYGSSLSTAAPYALNFTLNNPTANPGNDYMGLGGIKVSGNYAIIGGVYDDDAGANNAGSAFIYDITTGALLHTLTDPTVAAADYFGIVSISGNYALVGAYGDDTSALNAGIAYIFDVTTGSLIRTLLHPASAANAYFSGNGVHLSETATYALIASSGDSVSGNANAGRVYVYDVATGALLYALDNPDPDVDDYFGPGDISDNYILVAARNDDAGASNAGSAYLYDTATGTLLYTFHNPTPEVNDYWGLSPTLSGHYAILSSFYESSQAYHSGAIDIFDTLTGDLVRTIYNPTPAANDQFGITLSASGQYLAVGCYLDDYGGSSDEGSVYIYDIESGELLLTIHDPSPANNTAFGGQVSLDGNTLLVNAYYADIGASNTGVSYIYQIDFTDSDTLYGGDGNDTLYGLYGDDRLYGQGGSDTLIGGEGGDRFIFEGDSAFSGVDTIQDFDMDEGDVIDISDVLSLYNKGVDDISDFVQFVDQGADSALRIDVDGMANGSVYVQIALLEGHNGLDATTLETAGWLITA